MVDWSVLVLYVAIVLRRTEAKVQREWKRIKDKSKQNIVQAPSLLFLSLCCLFTVKKDEDGITRRNKGLMGLIS